MLCTFSTEKLLGLKLDYGRTKQWTAKICRLRQHNGALVKRYSEFIRLPLHQRLYRSNAYGYRNFRRFHNRILHMFNVSTKNGAD
jgi:hypothetical protein